MLLCDGQNLALGGDRDDSKYMYLNSEKNTGNFQALLNFRIDSGDANLKEHFSTAQKNALYRLNTIHNELINILGTQIQERIVNDLNKAGRWFSVSADEVQVVSNKEQLAIFVRYADGNDQIQEKFMRLQVRVLPNIVRQRQSPQDVSGHTSGEALSTEILSALYILQLRSQCYDGAGNMMDKVEGVAARIQQQYPKVLSFWCSSHHLNRCIGVCDVKDVRNMMGIADQNIMHKSHTLLCIDILDSFGPERNSKSNKEDKKKLHVHSELHWTRTVTHAAVVDTLSQILDTEKRQDAVTETNGLLHAITTFQFIITLVDVDVLRCPSYIKVLSIVLQDKCTHVDAFYTQFFIEAVSVADQVGIHPAIPRRFGRQTQRNNLPASTPEEYCKRTLTISFPDHLIQQFGERFTILHERAATALLLRCRSGSGPVLLRQLL